jgi:hypothetical protein
MDTEMVLKVALGVAAVIFADALFVELRACAREAKRLITRLGAYGDLPIVSLLATTEHDVERLNVALEALPPLLERGSCALTVLRTFGRERPERVTVPAYFPNGVFPD